jgi:exopolyphosphatase / guanosine-5'-triphosphate,3'-diphosphate pyrophosphatase
MEDQGYRAPGHGAGGRRGDTGRLRADASLAANFAGTARYPRQPAYGAIDLGTNNCRLLIARPSPDGFAIIDAFSRIVRLGEGLAASGKISEMAMARAIEALSVCADKLVRRRVTLSRAVATEATRQAANGDEFVARVAEKTGIMLDIISPHDEAQLAMMGCHQLLEPGDGPALIFDIGGGSTELILVDDRAAVPKILDWESIPWGVVSLTEAVPHDSEQADARTAAYQTMRTHARDAFALARSRLGIESGGVESLRMLGTSGTVTTLGSLYLGLPAYDRRVVDGMIVQCADLRALCSELASRSIRERALMPCIGRERADLVVAGCAILEEICDIWPATQLRVADRGIREGVLRQLMASQLRERR